MKLGSRSTAFVKESAAVRWSWFRAALEVHALLVQNAVLVWSLPNRNGGIGDPGFSTSAMWNWVAALV